MASLSKQSCLLNYYSEVQTQGMQEKCSQSADESKRLESVVQTLKEIKAQKEFYSNIHTLLLILATLPFTTASAERSFSCLKRLKTYLRNIMGKERLSGLAQMQLHRAQVLNPEAVLDELAKEKIKLDFLL